jgi:hypothetical protein
MSSGADVQAARRLLADVIDSFEKLEILVYVYRSSYQVRSTSEIAKALSLPTDEVDQAVRSLTQQGVLDPSGPQAGAVAALVQMYEDDRIEVLNTMTKMALARVRKEAARVFADAFVLRPPKKKGDPDA